MRRAGTIAVVAVLGVLCMAPTPGDVGGCGAKIEDLDVPAFVEARKNEDCARCKDCGLTTPRCVRACDPAKPPDTNLPSTCRPLIHDGEVCLRALGAASCSAYATYVADVGAATPSECDFCQFIPPEGIPSFAFDAGTGDASP